ncbi:hypothetical protein H0H92_007634 [Tricholoma furcatifolium]|nr:hypothetical protein H0H92_007634 [Tricholoma furcatifolium]
MSHSSSTSPTTDTIGYNDSSDDVAVLAAIQTNSALSESTCNAARTLLQKAQNELGSLDDEIARVQSLLNDLHHRRHAKIVEIDICSTANAPIRKVATEILSYIFVLCCFDIYVSPFDQPTKQQYILGMVCSKWRQISLATPELWSRIHIDNSKHSYGRPPGIIPYADYLHKSQHLRRLSGLSPLSLTFLHETTHASTTLDPFLPDLARVTALSIDDNSSAAAALLAFPASSLPALRTLEFRTEIDLTKGSNLFSSPNLRELVYTGGRTLQQSSWLAKLPLSQLTRLVVPNTFLTPKQLLSLLTFTHCLVEGSFAVSSHIAITEGDAALSLPIDDSSNPCQLVIHMVSLELMITYPTNCKDLQSIIFPDLRHCIIATAQATPRPWDSRWMPTTCLRSRMLETLRIEDSILTEGEIERIMLDSPYLTELELESGAMLTSSILQGMASGQLAPRLRKLGCLISFTNLSDYGALDLHLDMLEQRKKETTPAAHIAEVHFSLLCAEPSEKLFPGLERMATLVSAGWNITKSQFF